MFDETFKNQVAIYSARPIRKVMPTTEPAGLVSRNVEPIPSATLQRWTRTAPAEPPRPRPEPPGDARVLWGLVLALLALETFVRRRPAMSRSEDLRRAA